LKHVPRFTIDLIVYTQFTGGQCVQFMQCFTKITNILIFKRCNNLWMY